MKARLSLDRPLSCSMRACSPNTRCACCMTAPPMLRDCLVPPVPRDYLVQRATISYRACCATALCPASFAGVSTSFCRGIYTRDTGTPSEVIGKQREHGSAEACVRGEIVDCALTGVVACRGGRRCLHSHALL